MRFKMILAVGVLALVASLPYSQAGTQLPSPLTQSRNNVPADKVVCAPDLQIIMKKSDGMPACVKAASVAKLIESGCGLHVLSAYVKDEPKNSDIFEQGPHQITTEGVPYNNSTGFLARPSESGMFPGVILIHEWWGLNDNMRNMAKNLASHGYTVFAADLYAGQVATTPEGARQILTTFDAEKGISNIHDVVEILKTRYGVEKVATIGWCSGGTQSLNYALSGNELDATILYYGQPVTDEDRLAQIHWPVLGIFGGKDPNISAEKISEFESALNDLGIVNEIHVYPGVGHGFANPSAASHSPEAAKDAWQKTVAFLEKHLQKE